MKPEIIRCPACGRKARRSHEANKRYWALLHKISSEVEVDGKHYSADVFHEYFKQEYIGADEINLPDGRTIIKSWSSAELDIVEFMDYMTQVEAFANDHGVHFAD